MRIKDILKNKGMTQQELATNMGVTKQFVGQMLKSDSLTTNTLERVANALNVPIWQLFVSEDDVVEHYGKVNLDDKTDFTALVKRGGELYSASSLQELRALVDRLEGKSTCIKE